VLEDEITFGVNATHYQVQDGLIILGDIGPIQPLGLAATLLGQ